MKMNHFCVCLSVGHVHLKLEGAVFHFLHNAQCWLLLVFVFLLIFTSS